MASLLLTACVVGSSAMATKPHIVFFMADDLGHANVGWHRQQDIGYIPPEVQTPNMDALVADGIDLQRTYVYMFCSPTRSSFLSGRLPINVNMLNTDPASYSSISGEGAGIATNMTGIATVLAKGGYYTAVSMYIRIRAVDCTNL